MTDTVTISREWITGAIASMYLNKADTPRDLEIIAHLKAALASPSPWEEEGIVALPKSANARHDPATGPCPTCGFHITMKKRPPFVFDVEDQ